MGSRARKAYVEHLQFDHNTILNFICWRFGLDPLAARSQSSLNLAYALNLDGVARTDAPQFSVPSGPFNGACLPVPGVPPGSTLPVAALPFLGIPAVSASTVTGKGYEQHQAEWQGLAYITQKLRFHKP